MEVLARVSVPVTEQSQIGDARRTAVSTAYRLGYSEEAASNLAILVSELASNLVKHTAQGGTMLIQPRNYDGKVGIEVISINGGPGMPYPDRVLDDGFSTAGSLGTGLGAVRRLSSSFDFFTAPAAGTVLSAVVMKEKTTEQLPFDVACISLPHKGETVCGDGWATKRVDDELYIMVADGLGHGLPAADAARAAIDTFRSMAPASPKEIAEQMHKDLRTTRGAAVSIIRVKGDAVTHCGLGNINTSIVTQEKRSILLSHDGTAGFEARRIREYDYPWSQQSSLVIHSDGCSSGWSLDEYPGLINRKPSVIAGVIFRDFNKNHDDVTVLAARNASGGKRRNT